MYEGQNTAMGISHLCRYKVDTELRSAVQCTVEALTLKRPTKFFVLQKKHISSGKKADCSVCAVCANTKLRSASVQEDLDRGPLAQRRDARYSL